MRVPRFPSHGLVAWISLLALAAIVTPATARQRVGFQNMETHRGGYSVTIAKAPEDNVAGPATVRVRSARDGRSARVTWTSTFYRPSGPYRVSLQWRFRPDGRVVMNSLDPRRRAPAATGTFTIRGRAPVRFSAVDPTGLVTARGELRLIGGGTLAVTLTITGLPEGEVTATFTGSRAP